MFSLFKNPTWINYKLSEYSCFEDVPQHVFDDINVRLRKIVSKEPIISIIISAWNEEVNIIRCIDTISRFKSQIPFEIIIVNNNSQDKTQNSLDKLAVKSFFQPIQGCGPSRQLAQENAMGKYILLADADCYYPPQWIDYMYDKLKRPNVVAVYGRYSFITDNNSQRIKLLFYEKLKDIVAEIRHINRPFLNAYGISMGYLKEAGLKAGYINHNTWGDDGRLVFDMMKYGKVLQVKNTRARVWTGQRSLFRDGNLTKALVTRLVKEAVRFKGYFTKLEEHDTKTSKNGYHTLEDNIKVIKRKFKITK